LTSAANAPLPIADVDRYRRNGILRVTLPPEITGLFAEFCDDIVVWVKHFLGRDLNPAALPLELTRLAREERAVVAKLYKIARRFRSSKQIAAHQWLADASKQLMQTPTVSCCHFVNIRFDFPGEDKYLLPLHQDFPYIQGSLDGVTWWIPFFTCPLEQGPPSFIRGSHTQGMRKVKYSKLDAVGGSGGKSFAITENLSHAEEDFTMLPLNQGEAFVFHTLLLHRSEVNTTDQARINIQVRFDDPLAAESYDRNYPEGLYLGDLLEKNFSEYVVSDEKGETV